MPPLIFLVTETVGVLRRLITKSSGDDSPPVTIFVAAAKRCAQRNYLCCGRQFGSGRRRRCPTTNWQLVFVFYAWRRSRVIHHQISWLLRALSAIRRHERFAFQEAIKRRANFVCCRDTISADVVVTATLAALLDREERRCLLHFI